MARPGIQVIQRETAPARGAPTDTSVWFVVGLAEKGPLEPVLIKNMSDFVRELGDRQSYSVLYDALDTYFHEGGSQAYVSRVVGPAAASSFVVLNDAGAAATLRVEAMSPGEWGNSLNIAVLAGDAGGEFKLEVSHDVLGILETSLSLVDKAAAFAWADNSDYINLIDQASLNDPAVIAATGLAGGADDRNNITDAHWETALGRFARDLGPGQVSAPGRTSSQAHIDLLEHGAANNRVALCDLPDTPTKATLLTSANAARNNGRSGAGFAPWLVVPGIVAGTLRTVPPSAQIAGQIARNDLVYNPNTPSAGNLGAALYAIGLSQPAWSDADREDLNDAGVNVIRMMYGGVRTYGWRSLADPVAGANWTPFGNGRLNMAIIALGEAIAENFVFDVIDGRGYTAAAYGGALTGMLREFYNEGALFGDTPADAFYVDTGPNVNTPERVADGELRAVVAVRMSPAAELVIIEIVKRAITEAVV